MNTDESSIETFISITGSTREQAIVYVKKGNNELNRAINLYIHYTLQKWWLCRYFERNTEKHTHNQIITKKNTEIKAKRLDISTNPFTMAKRKRPEVSPSVSTPVIIDLVHSQSEKDQIDLSSLRCCHGNGSDCQLCKWPKVYSHWRIHQVEITRLIATRGQLV